MIHHDFPVIFHVHPGNEAALRSIIGYARRNSGKPALMRAFTELVPLAHGGRFSLLHPAPENKDARAACDRIAKSHEADFAAVLAADRQPMTPMNMPMKRLTAAIGGAL